MKCPLTALAAAMALALLAVSCSGNGGSSGSSSQTSSQSSSQSSSQTSSQAPAEELDGDALLEEIFQDLDLMGVMEVDDTVMADLLNIPGEYYDSVWGRYSLARFNIGEAFIVKPSDKEGAAQFVQEKLEEYRQSRMDTFENYNVGGDYEKARDALLYQRGDYVILLILEDNAPAQELIEERIPQ